MPVVPDDFLIFSLSAFHNLRRCRNAAPTLRATWSTRRRSGMRAICALLLTVCLCGITQSLLANTPASQTYEATFIDASTPQCQSANGQMLFSTAEVIGYDYEVCVLAAENTTICDATPWEGGPAEWSFRFGFITAIGTCSAAGGDWFGGYLVTGCPQGGQKPTNILLGV